MANVEIDPDGIAEAIAGLLDSIEREQRLPILKHVTEEFCPRCGRRNGANCTCSAG